jgi:hypothetical protein
MKLDESIELKNKKQNIKEMNNLNNLPISEMRIAMQQMMEIEETSGCLYEVLVNEGFLPNELNEGGDYATSISNTAIAFGPDGQNGFVVVSAANNAFDSVATYIPYISKRKGV